MSHVTHLIESCHRYSVLQYVAVCCSVLLCVAVCCSVLLYIYPFSHKLFFYTHSVSFSLSNFLLLFSLFTIILPVLLSLFLSFSQKVAANNKALCVERYQFILLLFHHSVSVLQCVAVCCSVLQCVAVCCSVLQCVAVCCSMLQRVAVCYRDK